MAFVENKIAPINAIANPIKVKEYLFLSINVSREACFGFCGKGTHDEDNLI
jgi:hypothetical protein